MCRSKTIATNCIEATDSLVSLDTAFLNNITPPSPVANLKAMQWSTTIQVNGKPMTFKLDTGAEVTAISTVAHQQLGNSQLVTSDKILYGPSRQPLQVVGKFTATLSHKDKSSQQQVYVVEGNLLSLPAITALNLIARLDATANTRKEPAALYDVQIRKNFPTVFNGLGNLGEEFTIKLKPNAVPQAIYTARHVPLPLHPQVEKEFKCMESLGVISKVDQPTEWCAGMVVVPKKNGKVRICVGLKHLNESVLRDWVHPLPKVDETLAQLSGAKIFSKLDANSGFWQIPLDKPSRLLTTFITPFGRYRLQ